MQFGRGGSASVAVVISVAIPDGYVESGTAILDVNGHGHRITYPHDAIHLAAERTPAGQNVHPAGDVITIHLDIRHIHRVDGKRIEEHILGQPALPQAADPPGRVPHFHDQLFVLNEQDVLESGAEAFRQRQRSASTHRHVEPEFGRVAVFGHESFEFWREI